MIHTRMPLMRVSRTLAPTKWPPCFVISSNVAARRIASSWLLIAGLRFGLIARRARALSTPCFTIQGYLNGHAERSQPLATPETSTLRCRYVLELLARDSLHLAPYSHVVLRHGHGS